MTCWLTNWLTEALGLSRHSSTWGTRGTGGTQGTQGTRALEGYLSTRALKELGHLGTWGTWALEGHLGSQGNWARGLSGTWALRHSKGTWSLGHSGTLTIKVLYLANSEKKDGITEQKEGEWVVVLKNQNRKKMTFGFEMDLLRIYIHDGDTN